MKYYNKVPENYLLVRFVPSRYCNYRCQYCYLSLEKRTEKKTMFSEHGLEEWIDSLNKNFSDKVLEFYFTGGEPLLVKDAVLLIKEVVKWNNVIGIRIDSNISTAENFVKTVVSDKVKFLASFHPTQISMDKYLKKIKLLKEKDMIGMVNFVASKENFHAVKMAPHELVKIFDDMGIFLNLAKDFQRGLRPGYELNYKRYVDMFQYPLDTSYMDLNGLNRGFLCGGGKHYITINRHGHVFSCGGEMQRTRGHGNMFSSSLKLFDSLQECRESCCPSIVSYSFSCSNDFSPVDHTADYARRCSEIREGISAEYVKDLWNKIDINQITSAKKTPSKKIKEIINILRQR